MLKHGDSFEPHFSKRLWYQRPYLENLIGKPGTKPPPTVDAPTAPHKEVLRTFFTRDFERDEFLHFFL